MSGSGKIATTVTQLRGIYDSLKWDDKDFNINIKERTLQVINRTLLRFVAHQKHYLQKSQNIGQKTQNQASCLFFSNSDFQQRPSMIVTVTYFTFRRLF